MTYLIEDALRLDPIADDNRNEFLFLDRLDEAQIAEGKQYPLCHLLFNEKYGDLLSVAYRGMIHLAETFGIQRGKSETSMSKDSIVSICEVSLNGNRRYGASRAKRWDIAEDKAYRNGIRQLLLPVVFRNYAKCWIKKWTWKQFPNCSNLELATKICSPDCPFDNACDILWRAKVKGYNDWKIRYLLLREIRSRRMKVRRRK